VCDLEVIDAPSRLSLIRKDVVLARVLPTLDFYIKSHSSFNSFIIL
jgi:hypothetical protein